jgi:transposase InsO family protein
VKYLYEVFGLSKQGYYQRINRDSNREQRNRKVCLMVSEVRKTHTRAGTRKLMVYLKDDFEKEQIQIGRNTLNSILRANSLLVRKTKRSYVTTDSKHGYYKSPNLLKDTELTHSEQALVNDITYLKTDHCDAYLALATDPYSKKIMGYCVEDHMGVGLVKNVLSMAKKTMVFNHDSVIHHSDRGIQYCCDTYSQIAEKLNFKLSTTQQYDPYENAVAERINETLKYEFGLNKQAPNLKVLKKLVKQSVDIYNTKRVHWSLGLRTPDEVHRSYNSLEYKSYSKKKKVAM